MQTETIKPLTPLQALLYPFLKFFARGTARSMLRQQYAEYMRRKTLRRARRKIAKEIAPEAKLFEQILTRALTRMRFAYTPAQDHETAAGGKKHRVQRVRFQCTRYNEQLIYYRILTRKRGLLGSKNALPYGTFVTDIVTDERVLNELSIACERKVSAFWEEPQKGAWLIVHRLEGVGGIPKLVHFSDMLRYYPADMTKGTLILGVGDHKKVHYCDLAVYPHLLVGGTTGGGKSNLVNNFISSQIRFQDTELFKLVLIDLKRVEFGFYKSVPHLLCPIITNAKDSIGHLRSTFAEIEKRQELFDKAGVKELADWNRRNPDHKLPRIVTIIDEYAELMLSGSKIAKTVTHYCARISALGRAAGIHLIICTQRPDSKILPGLIRMNMPLIIAGYAPTQVQSIVLIGTGEAASLPADVKGRMIYAAGAAKNTIQTPLITDEDVRDAVRIAKGRHAGLINLTPVDPVVVPEGLVRFAMTHTQGSLAATDILSLLRDYGIDTPLYKNAVDELVKRQTIEIDDKVYLIEPGEQGYRARNTGLEIVVTSDQSEGETPAINPDEDTQPSPAVKIEDIEPAPAVAPDEELDNTPLAPEFKDVDHVKMIRKFVIARCETGAKKRIKVRDLYAGYVQWCTENQIDTTSVVTFSKILQSENFGFKSHRSNGTRYLRGIELSEVPEMSTVPPAVV